MAGFDVFNKTVAAWLDGKAADYKSAKGRIATDGTFFYSYRMPIGQRFADGHVEVLDAGRAPSITTQRHISALQSAARGAEVVYALGAPVCPKCGGRHGEGAYKRYSMDDSSFYGPRGYRRREWRTVEAAEDICNGRLAQAAAEREADKIEPEIQAKGYVKVKLVYRAAVRDAGLPFIEGPDFWRHLNDWSDPSAGYGDRVVFTSRAIYVAPEVAAVLTAKNVPHAVKRAVLAQAAKDEDFRLALLALAESGNMMQAFADNYLDEYRQDAKAAAGKRPRKTNPAQMRLEV